MTYTLWDFESANKIGTYPSKDAALTIVWRAIQNHGRAAIDSLQLFEHDEDVNREVASGSDLADIAVMRLGPARVGTPDSVISA